MQKTFRFAFLLLLAAIPACALDSYTETRLAYEKDLTAKIQPVIEAIVPASDYRVWVDVFVIPEKNPNEKNASIRRVEVRVLVSDRIPQDRVHLLAQTLSAIIPIERARGDALTIDRIPFEQDPGTDFLRWKDRYGSTVLWTVFFIFLFGPLSDYLRAHRPANTSNGFQPAAQWLRRLALWFAPKALVVLIALSIFMGWVAFVWYVDPQFFRLLDGTFIGSSPAPSWNFTGFLLLTVFNPLTIPGIMLGYKSITSLPRFLIAILLLPLAMFCLICAYEILHAMLLNVPPFRVGLLGISSEGIGLSISFACGVSLGLFARMVSEALRLFGWDQPLKNKMRHTLQRFQTLVR